MFLVVPADAASLKTLSIEEATKKQSKTPGSLIVEVVYPSDNRRLTCGTGASRSPSRRVRRA